MKIKRFLLRALCLAVGCALPAMAHGGVLVTNTLEVGYLTDNGNRKTDDDNFGAVIDRFNVTGNAGDVSTWARFDLSRFIDRPVADYDGKYLLERLSVQYRLDNWRLTVGDFYRQLGRGITLSLRKADEVSPDMAIRGGQAEYSSSTQQLVLFGGWVNTANTDPVTMKHVDDVDDQLLGFLYEFRGLDGINVGAVGSMVQPQERLGSEADWTQSGGIYLDGPGLADWLSVYVEGDVQRHREFGNDNMGYAGYGAADLMFGDTTLLLEGVYLNEVRTRSSTNSATGSKFIYNRPPTLERLQDEVATIENVQGARMRLEHYIEDLELTISGNFVYKEHLKLDETLLHGYAGIESVFQDGRSRIKLEGGYRDAGVKRMFHFYTDYVQAVVGRYSLHIISDNEYRYQQQGGSDDFEEYLRGSTFFGVEKAGLGELTFELGYDDNPASDVKRTLFYAAIATWRLSGAFQVRATAGTQRGGLKCINGICRIFPAFAGAKAEVVTRF